VIAISEDWVRLLSAARRKQSSIENTEVVGKVFLRTLCNNIIYLKLKGCSVLVEQ